MSLHISIHMSIHMSIHRFIHMSIHMSLTLLSISIRPVARHESYTTILLSGPYSAASCSFFFTMGMGGIALLTVAFSVMKIIAGCGS